jgi:hypothetical protein
MPNPPDIRSTFATVSGVTGSAGLKDVEIPAIGNQDNGAKANTVNKIEPENPRVRANKLEFRRLDELYDKSAHKFFLAETAKSPSAKEDVWEEYVFVVIRIFGIVPLRGCACRLWLTDRLAKCIPTYSSGDQEP